MASSWGGSFGAAWGNSWGVAVEDTGGVSRGRFKYPKNIVEYLTYKQRFSKANLQVLETALSEELVIEEIQPQVEEIKSEYQEHLDLLNTIPDYETDILSNQIEAFINSIELRILQIKQSLDFHGLDLNLIIALVASDMGEEEMAVVIATI